MKTIEDLLQSMLSTKETLKNLKLENTKSTWERIGNKDSFSELGFDSEKEKEEFLKNWIEENDYTNI